MKIALTLASFSALLSTGTAHSIFQELHVNGVTQGHAVGIRVPKNNYPVEDVNSKDIICHGKWGFRLPISDKIVKVPAGANVTAEWHSYLPGDQYTLLDPIALNHKGPIVAYLAKVSDAAQSNVEGLKWFKIYEDGLDRNKVWATEKFIQAKGMVGFRLPKCIEPGQYLLRVEIIALHLAHRNAGSQHFLSCAQLEITGGGSVKPAALANFPGAYNNADRSLKLWVPSEVGAYPLPNDFVYHIPGPPVLDCDNLSTNTPWTPTVIPASDVIQKGGQCGGRLYGGPTKCETPSKCVKRDDELSLCV
ncbi:endoglucanase II [Coprinopsis marcescibilis]|uniref:AA9 family lytic polysaccharide monooxygenase n=1 Tax=Coprinopsis marcescibilis TaxID=230819 RepID=A0A5C3KYA8_COPMA|nr:endoglucanase II [Coprinopsis marcescibilis]